MGACAGMVSSEERVSAIWASISGSEMTVGGDLKISMWIDTGVCLLVVVGLHDVVVRVRNISGSSLIELVTVWGG